MTVSWDFPPSDSDGVWLLPAFSSDKHVLWLLTLGKVCYHTGISGFLSSLSISTGCLSHVTFLCLSRQANCNPFSRPTPSLIFSTSHLWFKLTKCVWELGVRTCSTLSQVTKSSCEASKLLFFVIIIIFFSEAIALVLHGGCHLSCTLQWMVKKGLSQKWQAGDHVIQTKELFFSLSLMAQQRASELQFLSQVLFCILNKIAIRMHTEVVLETETNDSMFSAQCCVH